MPAYLGVAQAVAYDGHNVASLRRGSRGYFFGTRTNPAQPLGDGNITAEIPTVGESSIEFCLAKDEKDGSGIYPNVGIELLFSANPGAFNIQLQEADTPADGLYITPTPNAFTITAVAQVGNTGFYAARVDLGTIGSRFIRLFVSALANAVGLIAKVTVN